ncbi:hypothetical protein FOA43_001829 [Brettanomyces nanus]|uniref:Uncharacterized protein n=1 Tax=Eeniella nana TaxID=13502 RepID=A0A875S3Z8_EENNA|nr:uncharacterized protein FOA43_001829 [Brettanomyces nanus]QPG74499.1 hypothetical protein FOA43_001829 [Brettanomyces nanus]
MEDYSSSETPRIEEDYGNKDNVNRENRSEMDASIPLEARRMNSSYSHSLARTITSTIGNELRTVPSLQEIEVESTIGPSRPQFWKPGNIMSVEDTPFSKRYLVLLEVVFGSILGNMARISLTKLTSYQNEYLHYSPGSCLWSNFSACFIMAWCNHAVGFWDSLLLDSGKNNMKQMALHTGITAGFCGSFSTWSSLVAELLFKTIDALNGGYPLPNSGYGVLEFFAVLLIQMGVSFFGYYLGRDFAALLDLWAVFNRASRLLNYKVCRIFELTTAGLAIAGFIANLVLTCTLPLDNFWKKDYSLSILFGVVGAILRFQLSKYNGKFHMKWFPAGTLMANVLACTVLAVVTLLNNGYIDSSTQSRIVSNKVHRMVINAFVSGFCGSLSTISSFVNELYNLKHPIQRYTYFSVTFLPSFIIMLLIDGTFVWTRGFIQ